MYYFRVFDRSNLLTIVINLSLRVLYVPCEYEGFIFLVRQLAITPNGRYTSQYRLKLDITFQIHLPEPKF